MIVTDASALVDLLLDRSGAATTSAALAEERVIHAPHLIETEVLHALRRWVRASEIPKGRADAALTDLAELPVVHHAHAPLNPRVWALRDRFSAYDATYVALAEVLEAKLITADRRLARGAGELVAVIEAV